jgi:hypothetical protein
MRWSPSLVAISSGQLGQHEVGDVTKVVDTTRRRRSPASPPACALDPWCQHGRRRLGFGRGGCDRDCVASVCREGGRRPQRARNRAHSAREG